MISLSQYKMRELVEAVRTTNQVSGYTHCFYRYPARFSPLFARKAIEVFTKPGDMVLDPFMGGGTTLVEARVSGRIALGLDINELAVFVARIKTSVLSHADVVAVNDWAEGIRDHINLSPVANSRNEYLEEPYMRHMQSSQTWRLRRLIESGLNSLQQLRSRRQQDLVRCALLATGQWALDCRRKLPSTSDFRHYLQSRIETMLIGATQFARAARRSDRAFPASGLRRTLCINRPASKIEDVQQLHSYPAPSLILTSPPYPGVHVLYHRWQIQSRRETGLPYWIANCQDGTGSSYYTFGDRKQHGLTKYFEVAKESFSSIRSFCDSRTIVAQLVAFSDPTWQLPRYLRMMEKSGFTQISEPLTPDDSDPLICRRVPNRKWYAAAKGDTPSSNEILLIHRPTANH